MFLFANFLFVLIACTNLYGVLLGKAPNVREISIQLVGVQGGLDKLRKALWAAALAQVYLIALVFPLKALNVTVAFIWSILMLVSVLETIYTARKMHATAAGTNQDVAFPFHDSVIYRAYQVVFNVATIAVCIFLMTSLRG
jgi:hypothetical protein